MGGGARTDVILPGRIARAVEDRLVVVRVKGLSKTIL
jgi:hypothetical protein